MTPLEEAGRDELHSPCTGSNPRQRALFTTRTTGRDRFAGGGTAKSAAAAISAGDVPSITWSPGPTPSSSPTLDH